MIKKSLWVLSFAFILLLAACASTAAVTPPAATAPAAGPPLISLASDGVVASAEVVPVHASRMSLAISAPVKDVLVREGDLVAEGQVLLTLYSPDLELSVTSAELALKAAELDLKYWRPRYDRPPERRQQAEAETEEARTRLRTAQADFAQSSLLAPFNGTVVDLRIQPGEVAQRGQVVIVLGDLTLMQIETTDLSERDVPLVQIGQRANVYVEALDLDLGGTVISISPISETVGGDVVYPVTIELDEQPDSLLWGMSAEVEIQTRQ